MHNIILIFTKHEESGCCNSNELHRIIESISPEIIFEELSYSNHYKCYQENSLITLETNAIKKYLLDHNIKHIPVDTFDLPESYYEKVDYMYNKIFNNIIISECLMLRNLIDYQLSLTSQLGFRLLNSNQNDEIFAEIDNLKKKVLNIINDEKLLFIYNLEKEIIEKREEEIINNIYNYSKEHQYNLAIQFIGSGHRESIIKKIKEYNSQEEIKLNWNFYTA